MNNIVNINDFFPLKLDDKHREKLLPEIVNLSHIDILYEIQQIKPEELFVKKLINKSFEECLNCLMGFIYYPALNPTIEQTIDTALKLHTALDNIFKEKLENLINDKNLHQSLNFPCYALLMLECFTCYLKQEKFENPEEKAFIGYANIAIKSLSLTKQSMQIFTKSFVTFANLIFDSMFKHNNEVGSDIKHDIQQYFNKQKQEFENSVDGINFDDQIKEIHDSIKEKETKNNNFRKATHELIAKIQKNISIITELA